MQLTLALIKPDLAVNTKLVEIIEKRLMRHKFSIIEKRKIQWTPKTCELFYAQHSGRFFYQRLVEFMGTGPTIALILAKENAIADWRRLMGPTKVYKTRCTHPNTIRGEFGLTDTRNSVHGSDSEESAQQEISIFFPNFNTEKWHADNKTIVRCPKNALLEKIPCAETINARLGVPETWSEYYSSPTKNMADNWFVTYDDIKDELGDILRKHSHIKKVLDLGCGLSDLGERLQNDFGRLEVFATDVSTECLLQNSYNSDGFVTYLVSDVWTSIPFDEGSIDLVIDKGTYDAIYRHPFGQENCLRMMSEVLRVLSPSGMVLQITTDSPDTRLDELQVIKDKIGCNLSTSFFRLAAESNNLLVYMYVIKKEERS